MNDDDTISIDLSEVKPVEFVWNECDMSTGVAYHNTVTLNSGISITATGLAAGSNYTMASPFDDMEKNLQKLEQRLQKLEYLIAEEEEVRRTHPAVQMAYDEYRLLYILAKKNPGDVLTDE